MGSYIVRRFFLMLITLIGMSIVIFALLRLVPGNIADILFDSAGFVDPSEKAALEEELGLSDPIYVQYWDWIWGMMHGDLGYSYVSERPTIDEIAPRIPITAKLAVLALFFSVVMGVPLGVISAVKQNTPIDYALRVLSLSGLSLPSFWLASTLSRYPLSSGLSASARAPPSKPSCPSSCSSGSIESHVA